MQKINNILGKRFKYQVVEKKGLEPRVNTAYEIADEFAKYVGLNTIFVLKLFKIYGREKVLDLRSFLKDYPDKEGYRDKSGLVVHLLKNDLV